MVPRRLQPTRWEWQGFKAFPKPNVRVFGYLLVQLLILLVPSTWFALKYPILVQYGYTTLDQVVYTAIGISGLVALAPFALLGLLVGETIGEVLGLTAYVLLAILLFLHCYAPTWKRVFLVSAINGYLTAWSLLWGLFLGVSSQY
jgi:hypothetical protein